MIKNIKIGEKEVQLDNNIGWTMIYKDQFGADIIQTIMPVMAAALDLIAGLVRETGKKENITWTDILRLTDGDTLLEAAAPALSEERRAAPQAQGLPLSLYQLDDPLLLAIKDELMKLDINKLSPLDAFDALRGLKKKIGL